MGEIVCLEFDMVSEKNGNYCFIFLERFWNHGATSRAHVYSLFSRLPHTWYTIQTIPQHRGHTLMCVV